MDALPSLPHITLRDALQGTLPAVPSMNGTPVAASQDPATPSVGTAVANAVVGSFGPLGALLSLFHPTDTAQAAKGLLLLLVLIVIGLALTIGGAYVVATD